MDLYMMNCELLATCSALGFLEGDTYHKEPDCIESVKDLIRYLRHEDETRDIRQQLGAAQILQNDLIPIIIQYPQDKQLGLMTTQLNWLYLTIIDKVSVSCFPRLMVNLTQPAILCFGKIPQDINLRHHFLQIVSYLQGYKEAFASDKVFGLLSEKLYELLQLDWEQRQEEDNLLIERILLLVRNVLHVPADPDEEKNPELLAATGQTRSAKEQSVDVAELEVLRQKEQAEKKTRVFQRSSRHSRFGGCYVIQGLKAIGDRDVVMHKGLHNVKNYSHDLGKEVRRVPKRQQLASDGEAPSCRSALNVRRFLQEFCVEFLENCYNRLMYLVKDHLLREKAQQHDETYYLWAMAFFMAFNRASTFQPQLVSETVGVRTFHFIERSLTNYYEMSIVDKKDITSWSKRMHLALKAYQELLMTMHEMDHSQEEAVRNSSHVLKNNIFYMMEYRELFLTLFRKFDEKKQPRSFLRDLVETTHLFLKMLEKFCKGRKNLVVQSKNYRRKKKSKAHSAAPGVQPQTPEELEEVWPKLVEQIDKCIKGFESPPDDVIPFDAASEVPLEEQRAEAMTRIQDSLLTGQAPEALSLLRSASWINDIFLKTSCMYSGQAATDPDESEEAAEDEEAAEEELASVQVSEKEFSFLDYVKRFASANVVKAYVLLFRNYQQNSPHTNHCVVKMLHRIAYDLKMEALLFQLSVFCLFNRLLRDPAAGAYKSTAVVREMTEGYTVLQEDGSSNSHKASHWTEKEEEELQELYHKYKEVEGEDVLDNILSHVGSHHRGRKRVARKLVQLGLVSSMRDFPPERRKGTRIVLWTEEQEVELRQLFEEFRDSDDILSNVMKHITAKRSKARIIEKMLSIGLVSERKELYKKRKRKSGSLRSNKTSFPKDSEVPDLDEIDDEDEEEKDDLDSEEEEDEEEELAKEDAGNDKDQKSWGGWSKKIWGDASDRKLVQSLRQEGFAGPLLWLQNCLKKTAAARGEDGCAQAVPLVPLTEESEDAMEHKDFQELLWKMGVRSPANEQESFWRIPAKLNSEQLRHMAAFIASEEMEGETQDQQTEDNSEEDHPEIIEPRGLKAETEERIQHPLGPKRSRSVDEEENHNQDSSDEDGPRPSSKRKCLRIEEDEG
ncbi:Protein timeless-like protein [Ophiophagus hannah]|uniref:Protein timeless-like protein n=1 Tax=Ophiophagus hannah TaxID=8665 RepID=V8PHP6_OPHHA|nr:Protein timeless-like protein [Ophiophagus hannah]